MNWRKFIPTKSKRGMSIMRTTIELVLFAALLPVIVSFIAIAVLNLSTIEATLLGLVTTFLVLGIVYGVIKKSGLMGAK